MHKDQPATGAHLHRFGEEVGGLFRAAYDDVRGLEARIVELEAAVAALNGLIEANTKRLAELENRGGERWYHDEE
jgi:hypothetical protein